MNHQLKYQVTEIKQYLRSKQISDKISIHLNEISKDGWELVNIISTVGALEFPGYVRFIWRKSSS